MYKIIFRAQNVISCSEIAHLMFKRNAGHSKWANIRHTKAAKDGAKSLIFTRLARQIKVAIQEGGSNNPNTNAKLSQVVEQARRVQMPTATIQSAIIGSTAYKKLCKTYLLEAKGPAGSVILFEIFTHNLTGIKQQVATLLRKHRWAFGDGGGKYAFDSKGIVEVTLSGGDGERAKPEDVLETATNHAIEADAEEVTMVDENTLEFVCDHGKVYKVQAALDQFPGYKVTSASVEYIPHPERMATLNEDDAKLCNELCEKLQNMDAVVRVYDNLVC